MIIIMISVKKNYTRRFQPFIRGSFPRVCRKNFIEVLQNVNTPSASVGASVVADLSPSLLLTHPERFSSVNYSFTTDFDVYAFSHFVGSNIDSLTSNNK